MCRPQLLAEGELAPGIQQAEFAARRERLAAAMPPGSAAVLPAAAPVFMAGIIPYPYRQDADFRYLTGITQPALAVILAPSHPAGLRPLPTWTERGCGFGLNEGEPCGRLTLFSRHSAL
jgi:Aminopeptidase P, N-terminal domain